MRVAGSPYVAPPAGTAPTVADPAAATRVLDALESALAAGDAEAAASLAPAADFEAGRLLESLADNARRLRVDELDLRYVDLVGVPDADGAWTVRADLTWALDGIDDGTARSEVEVGLRSVDGEVGVLGFTGGRVPLWLRRPVLVDRGEDTLVITAGADPAPYSRLARRAVAQVERVLGPWSSPLVVEVPTDASELDAVRGVPEGTYSAVAGVTAPVDGLLSPSSPVRVFINPAQLGSFPEVGAQLVMTHEAVHAATRAPMGDAPSWLLEGIADYVALRDTDLAVEDSAAQVLDLVREQGVPAQLPGESEFDTTAPHLGAAYEGAWLACEVLASIVGEDALVDIYLRTSDGEDLASALDDYGTDEAAVTAAWQRLLVRTAG